MDLRTARDLDTSAVQTPSNMTSEIFAFVAPVTQHALHMV